MEAAPPRAAAEALQPQVPLALTLLAFLGFISLALPDGLIGVAWPSIRRDFHLSQDALGALFLTTTAGYVASSVASGWLLQFLRLGNLLSLSCLLTAGSLLAYALAPGWYVMVSCGVLAGMGGGAIDSAINAFAARSYGARTLNLLHAFYGLGVTLGPLLMTSILLQGLPWQQGYLTVVGLQLALAGWFALTRKRWSAPAVHTSTTSAPLLATLRLAPAQIGALLFVLYCALEAGAGAWLFTLLSEARNNGTAASGSAVTAYWAGLMSARVVFALLPVQHHLQRWLRAAMIVLTCAAVLLALDLGLSVDLAAAASMGFCAGPIFPWLITTTAARVGTAHATNAIGAQIGAASIGLACGPALIGVVAVRFDTAAIAWALVALAVLILVAHEVLQVCSLRAAHRRSDS